MIVIKNMNNIQSSYDCNNIMLSSYDYNKKHEQYTVKL